jgi:hypothetical protein
LLSFSLSLLLSLSLSLSLSLGSLGKKTRSSKDAGIGALSPRSQQLALLVSPGRFSLFTV